MYDWYVIEEKGVLRKSFWSKESIMFLKMSHFKILVF